jgi:hypothetical protein
MIASQTGNATGYVIMQDAFPVMILGGDVNNEYPRL